jgi:hypothetical protein
MNSTTVLRGTTLLTRDSLPVQTGQFIEQAFDAQRHRCVVIELPFGGRGPLEHFHDTLHGVR